MLWDELKDETGAGTIHAAVIIFSALSILFILIGVQTFKIEKQKLQVVADFIALSAAEQQQFGVYGCNQTAALAEKNNVNIQSCSSNEEDETAGKNVVVEVKAKNNTLISAVSKAGPGKECHPP